MKFRFCGGLDCPDWILAQIPALSKLTSVKLRLVCSFILNSMLGAPFQEEKAIKAMEDGGFDSSGMKAALGALEFILTSAAKHGCNAESLNSELQQLGLPAELSDQICKALEAKRKDFVIKLQQNSLKLNSPTFRSTNHTNGNESYTVLTVENIGKAKKIAISHDDLAALKNSLNEAKEIMEKYEKRT